jgi:putative endonuclease
VEVKLRTGSAYGDPLEAVTPRKRATVRALAEKYLSERELEPDDLRFDAVGILIDRAVPELRHVRDAF